MTLTYESVVQHLIEYLHIKLGGAKEITEHSHFTQDLNIESLQVFEILEELELTYHVVIPLELLYKRQIQTVSDLVHEVMQLLRQKT